MHASDTTDFRIAMAYKSSSPPSLSCKRNLYSCKMGSEELRQEVFSSIHLSSLVKSTQASITYPSCSFCGGGLVSFKGSPKRKVALCQLTLYTNTSESFVVWYKKQDEPKGMLWLGSYCVRKGQESAIELISRSCRGRCSYTLKFSAAGTSDEWYRLLKQESRKVPTICDELPGSGGEDDNCTSLDCILTDTSPLSVTPFSDLISYRDENSEELRDTLEPITPPATQSGTKSKSPKVKSKSSSKKTKQRVKSTPVLCNPLHSIGGKNKKAFGTTYSTSAVTMGFCPLDSVENGSDDQLARWSWPLKA